MKFIKFIIATFFSGLAAAQVSPPLAYATSWKVTCNSSEEDCVIDRYFYTDKEQTKRLAGVGIRLLRNNSQILVTLISPLGVMLQSGISLQFSNGKSEKRDFLFCDAGGCISQFSADKEWFKTFHAHKKIDVVYQLLDGNKLILPIESNDLYQEIEKRSVYQLRLGK